MPPGQEAQTPQLHFHMRVPICKLLRESQNDQSQLFKYV